jgi:RNA-directed DNA polymerase
VPSATASNEDEGRLLQGRSAQEQARGGQFRLSRLRLSPSIGLGAALAEAVLGFTPAVSKSALNAMRATIRGLNIRTRTAVTLDDIAGELNPKVRGWIAYYGRYTRSALYPMARYINQTLAVWLKRKYKRFHRRLGRARLFLAKIAPEDRRRFVHWQLGDGGELA